MGKFKDAWSVITGSGVAISKSASSDIIAQSSQQWHQLAEWLGIDSADTGSMSEATYYACLKVLSESLGKMPLKVMQRTDKGGVTTMREHPLYQVLANRPNPYMTAATFWATLEQNRNHYGNAYALIDGAGKGLKLWPIPSTDIEIWYDNAKLISEIPDVYYMWSTPKGMRPLKSEEVLHFKTSNTFNGIVGVSVADQLKMTISGNIKGQEVLNKLYDSGFTAKAVMQYTGDLSEENANKFVRYIETYAKGELKNQGIDNIIPLPIGSTLTPLNIKLADAQFLEIRKYSALQIASAFGIKPYQIGDYTKESYASQSAQQLAFYVDTLLFILKQYEEEITYKLFTDAERRANVYAKFNEKVILRVDPKTQMETLAAGVGNFIIQPNEARSELDREAVEGGDVLLGNGASIPVQLAGTQYTGNDTGGGGDK